jgi:hypothetical protein
MNDAGNIVAVWTDRDLNMTNGTYARNLLTGATSPAPPSAPDLAPASDSGNPIDNLTNDNTPTFIGTAEAGVTVHILADGVEVGSGPVIGGNYSITTSTLSDGTHAIRAFATDGSGTHSVKSAILNVTIDTIAPTMAQTPVFHFESAPHSLTYVFSEDVSPSLMASDLTVQNLTSSTTVTVAMSYVQATRTAVFTFPGYASGILPNGNYRATFAGGSVSDQAANPMGGHVFEFFLLLGDANLDRIVDIVDLGVVGTNWQQSGLGWAGGDFDGSGLVDIGDFGVVGTYWQISLPLPSAEAGWSQVLVGDSAVEELPGRSRWHRRHRLIRTDDASLPQARAPRSSLFSTRPIR